MRLQIEGMRSLVRGVPNAARRVDKVRSDQAVPYAKTIGNLGDQDMLSLSVVSASHGQCAISHLEIRARTFDLFGKEVGASSKALLRDRQADRSRDFGPGLLGYARFTLCRHVVDRLSGGKSVVHNVERIQITVNLPSTARVFHMGLAVE